MRNVIVSVIVGLAVTAAPALAQGAKKAAAKKPMSDRTFVEKAAAGGLAEVELGKLAEQKGTNDQVKSFGRRMVEDHSKANDELKTLAQSKNITLPADLDTHDQALKDRLSKLSGPAFDHAYMQAMVSDHRKDLNEFRRESTAGKDADVKTFASKTLPTLEDHLKMAQDTSRAVGTSGTTSKGNTPKK